jgi:V8-like Glu-specific endopeptidase
VPDIGNKQTPSHVNLQSKSGGMCSGTLIAPDKVLSAAHCLGGNPSTAKDWQVSSLGPNGPESTVDVAKAYINPGYGKSGKDQINSDNAIFHLRKPLHNPTAKLDYSNVRPGDTIQETGIGTTKRLGYDRDTQRQIVSAPSPNEVRRVTTTVNKPNKCDHQGICMDANNQKANMPGDSGGGIYKNGKLVGNVVGNTFNTVTGNILNDNGAKLDQRFINNAMNAKIREKRV